MKPWHIVMIDESAGGYDVTCIPHGVIGQWPAHCGAFLGAYEHDHLFTGDLAQGAE